MVRRNRKTLSLSVRTKRRTHLPHLQHLGLGIDVAPAEIQGVAQDARQNKTQIIISVVQRQEVHLHGGRDQFDEVERLGGEELEASDALSGCGCSRPTSSKKAIFATATSSSSLLPKVSQVFLLTTWSESPSPTSRGTY